MFTKYLVPVLSVIFAAECFVEDYQFVSEMNGFLKLHRWPEKWQDARLRCHLEGGVLAFPTNRHETSAMEEILSEANIDIIYTGIHAMYSSGDFTSLTGIPVSKMDLAWDCGERSNFKDKRYCAVMNQIGVLKTVDCDTIHPYMCYKSTDKSEIHKCHADFLHSDYRYDNRTGSCYKFHKEGRSWSIAFKTCMAEDAYLAIINSDTESRVLQDVFNEYPQSAIPAENKNAASIGFTKWVEIGEWFTIHGESLAGAGFSNFNDGEPNNADKPEWCGSVMRNGRLNDHNCDKLMPFICEKSPLHGEETENENQQRYIISTKK